MSSELGSSPPAPCVCVRSPSFKTLLRCAEAFLKKSAREVLKTFVCDPRRARQSCLENWKDPLQDALRQHPRQTDEHAKSMRLSKPWPFSTATSATVVGPPGTHNTTVRQQMPGRRTGAFPPGQPLRLLPPGRRGSFRDLFVHFSGEGGYILPDGSVVAVAVDAC